MISLKLHYEPPFCVLTNKTDEIINFESESLDLTGLFEHFYGKFGDKFKVLVWHKTKEGELHQQLVIIINGRTYRDDNFLKTPLKNGDDISFLYVYFGG